MVTQPALQPAAFIIIGTYALPGEFIPAFKTVNVEFPEIVTYAMPDASFPDIISVLINPAVQTFLRLIP